MPIFGESSSNHSLTSGWTHANRPGFGLNTNKTSIKLTFFFWISFKPIYSCRDRREGRRRTGRGCRVCTELTPFVITFCSVLGRLSTQHTSLQGRGNDSCKNCPTRHTHLSATFTIFLELWEVSQRGWELSCCTGCEIRPKLSEPFLLRGFEVIHYHHHHPHQS